MKRTLLFNLLLLLLPLSVLNSGCAKKEADMAVSESAPMASAPGAPRMEDALLEEQDLDGSVPENSRFKARAASAGKDQLVRGGAAGEGVKKTGGQNQPAAFPGKPGLPRFDVARDRLLEYHVNLVFRTEDVLKSRHLLYTIVARYGFLTQASTDSEDRMSVGAQFRVRSADLYKVIDELKVVGKLESESVSVTDHTEPMEWQRRKARRESIRSVRRGKAPATAKTWAQKEELISRSEDGRDQAEHEKWKINDRVAWANFSVRLVGPEAPANIEVPRFGNAFTGMINLLLNLLYGLIYISPLLLIAGGLFWAVRAWRTRRAKKSSV